MGELPGYHTAFTLNPVQSYGIIVLQSGPTSETVQLTKLITSQVQAAFDRVLEDVTRNNLVGSWRSADASVLLKVDIDHGSLYVSEYTVNGTDVLGVMQEGWPDVYTRLPLWPTDDHQFRLVLPTPNEGCFGSWVSLDMYGYIDGISTNVFVFDGSNHNERVLFLPAINVELRRPAT